MGTKVYNKLPGYIKETDSYKALRNSRNHFFFCIPFTQWKNVHLCNYVTFNIFIILHFKFIIYYKYTVF